MADHDLAAFGGWMRLSPDWPWRLLCTAACYESCWEWLSMQANEAQPATVASLVVLPKGVVPAMAGRKRRRR